MFIPTTLSNMLNGHYLGMVKKCKRRKSCIHDCVNTMMTDVNCASVMSIYYFTGTNILSKETDSATDSVEEPLRLGSSISSAPSFNSLLKIKKYTPAHKS